MVIHSKSTFFQARARHAWASLTLATSGQRSGPCLRDKPADLSVFISQRRLDYCISSPGKIPSRMAVRYQRVFDDSDTKHRKSLLMEVRTMLDLTAAECQTGQENGHL